MFYRYACDAIFIFHDLVKLSQLASACTHGQIVNDQLANQNARFIQVML